MLQSKRHRVLVRSISSMMNPTPSPHLNHLPESKKKRNQNNSSPDTLTNMHRDVIETIMNHMGLHAVNLRQTSKTFAQVALPLGAALALKALQVGPSIPLKLHVFRRTTRACTLVKWDYFSYRVTQQWRMEWALLLTFLKCAPINVLIDAFKAIPSGKRTFFGNMFIGNVMQDPTEHDYGAANSRAWKHNTLCFDESPTSTVVGSDYTSHVRIALYKAIEDRVWYVCQSTDLGKQMNPDQVVPTAKRIFNVVHVRNDRCFFFTNQGWLKYTPFMLAAEAHNFDLVRYLARRGDTDMGACSSGGNNARALCTHALSRRGWTAQEIAKSPVIKYLADQCTLAERPYIEEGRG